eukprot:8213-Hanusia_phi.AAC.1
MKCVSRNGRIEPRASLVQWPSDDERGRSDPTIGLSPLESGMKRPPLKFFLSSTIGMAASAGMSKSLSQASFPA